MRSLEEVIALDDGLSATLEEGMGLYELALDALKDDLLTGQTLTLKQSDDLCSPYLLLAAAWSCHARATGAHSRLQFWMARNGYATGLQLRQILMNYTVGSVLLLELIDSLGLALEYWQEVEDAVDERLNPPLFTDRL